MYLFTAVFALSLILTACSGDSGGGGGGTRVVPPGYDKIACKAAPPDQGKEALFVNLGGTHVVSGLFLKPFDRLDLEAVLDASSLSTTEYAKRWGVNIFRVVREDLNGACQTFYNLTTAPDDVQAVWNGVIANMNGPGRLAGLYWEHCGNQCRERQVVSPTILVDEAADRWTLVHEMMHHNFNVSRKADSKIPSLNGLNSTLRRSQGFIEVLMKRYQSNPLAETFQRLADENEKVVLASVELVVRSSFEEIAVEGQLVHEWATQNLKGTTSAAAKSALWYMDSSLQSGLATLENIDSIASFLRREIDTRNWQVPASLPRAEQALAAIQNAGHQAVDNAQAEYDQALSQDREPAKPNSLWRQPLRPDPTTHLESLEGAAELKAMNSWIERLRNQYPALN